MLEVFGNLPQESINRVLPGDIETTIKHVLALVALRHSGSVPRDKATDLICSMLSEDGIDLDSIGQTNLSSYVTRRLEWSKSISEWLDANSVVLVRKRG